MSAATLVSVEQFVNMPREERVRFELVEGELVPVASGTPTHAWIRDTLLIRLSGYLDREPIGIVITEIDCRTSDETVRRPDASFLMMERWRLANPNTIPLPFPPDIAVEVLSPSETAMDVSRKAHEYLAAGTREVWFIDPCNREIMIRTAEDVRLLAPETLLESPLLPGFSVPVSEVLASPPA